MSCRRFNTLVKAKVSSVLDRAEDPGETLDYSYEKQLELLQQTKSGIVDVVTSKKRLQQQEGTLREQITKLDGQARQALAGDVEEQIRLTGGAQLELVARYAGGDRLWLARFDGPETLHRYLAHHGRPIRYGYVPARWPLSAYQTAYAVAPGSAEMPSAGT
jgi:S-adenosylmethionine:tRNA-ribosyltransferase-isomerase (queuine synthetase)